MLPLLCPLLIFNLIFAQDLDITTTPDPYPDSGSCNKQCNTDDLNGDLLDVISYMTDLDYSVTNGAFELYDEETSNVYIPFARDDTDYFIAKFHDGGDGACIRFGGQDAIVFRTCTPPQAKYFGYRSYSAARIKKQDNEGNINEYTVLESSLGDTINQNVISTDNINNPFDSITNIVTTGDEQTWTDVINAFAESDNNLLLNNAINRDSINNGHFVRYHETFGRFRYSASEDDIPRDTISLIYRIVWDDASNCERESYFNQSFPFLVFQKNEKTPRCHINDELRPTIKKGQKCENCGENEYNFGKAITQITNTMEKDYNMKLVSNVELNDGIGKCSWFDWFLPNNDPNVYIFKHGYYCITFQKNCMFDNRDTYYSWDRTDHLLDDNDYYLIVGLNHNKFGMSTMNSISTYFVQDPDDVSNGNPFKLIQTVDNDEYEQYNFKEVFKCKKRRHLLNSYYHHHQHHDSKDDDNKNCQCDELNNVFAVQIARPDNCIDGLPSMCFDNDILSNDQRFIFFAESTLNPYTNTMPDEKCLIQWRLLKFTKKCDKTSTL